MKTKSLLAALLLSSSLTVPAIANPSDSTNTNVSGSASDANAISGSASGASSDNTNTNGQAQQANNAGIGNSASDSNSFSGAVSGSSSSSNGNQQGQGQDQGQGQSQSAASDQSQGQSANNSQGQSSSNTNSLGQQASNQQGVTVNQSWNTTNRKKTVQEFRTNAAVPLAASSSFSSDYCGGTASGGISAAPIGISIGGAGPTFDKSCQSLRRAEKFGMAAANWHNLGYDDRAVAMMRMMEWSICTSDSRGPKADFEIAEACDHVLGMAGSPPNAPTPLHHPEHEVTPEYTAPNVQPLPEQYKTPRGDLEFKTSPIIQATPEAAVR